MQYPLLGECPVPVPPLNIDTPHAAYSHPNNIRCLDISNSLPPNLRPDTPLAAQALPHNLVRRPRNIREPESVPTLLFMAFDLINGDSAEVRVC